MCPGSCEYSAAPSSKLWYSAAHACSSCSAVDGPTRASANASGVSNLTIEGAGAGTPGAPGTSSLLMDKAFYMANPQLYPKSEDRMGLAFYNCVDVTVRNLTIARTGGDGIYVNNLTRAHFIGVKALENYRQGMSIISATHLMVDECEFADTYGTEPMLGVDFEPNNHDDVLHNITLRNCLIAGNVGGGVSVGYSALTSLTPMPIDITFSGTSMPGDAGGAAIRIRWQPEGGSQPPQGHISFIGGHIANAVDAVFHFYGDVAADLVVADVTVVNPSRSASYIAEGLAPLLDQIACVPAKTPGNSGFAEDSPQSYHSKRHSGQTTFTNVTVYDTHLRPFLQASNTTCRLSVSGMTVHNPYGCKAELGAEAAKRHVTCSQVDCHSKNSSVR